MHTKFISETDFQKWIYISNLFAKSLLPAGDALKQFNLLDAKQRIAVKQAFDLHDNIRREKIPKGERDSAWELSVMVDAHIIATEYGIDPLTAFLCLKPPCKVNERIFVK